MIARRTFATQIRDKQQRHVGRMFAAHGHQIGTHFVVIDDDVPDSLTQLGCLLGLFVKGALAPFHQDGDGKSIVRCLDDGASISVVVVVAIGNLQIAIFTERINRLTDHLKDHKKDHSTRLGLLKLVGKRRSLLNYLMKHDLEGYRELIKVLNIRK